ncbi:hypothetical protein K491DRAFT_778946 [Lophiostoma macrostomum CBS 122681]|uniref:Heterokaryon incompatibility domain-containing protein n=1 Tax=Lophiostoma macrostomum CBS 122681 TaxID=1314788 RepID=A0A6A6T965_9PLEO|nr:hypothetical protein K491DRAFT_778946 [Lophiostoma macrostomum CBS 122681]
MSNDNLCSACQRVLGDAIVVEEWDPRRWISHHPDGESLRHALAKPCPLCRMVWEQCAKEQDLAELGNLSANSNGGTAWLPWTKDGVRLEVMFRFDDPGYGKKRARWMWFIPWEAATKRQYPDAITVTQKFKARYLWVDSLCIVQDSAEDWEREARRMKDIYCNARCCIAATSGEDGNSGLFYDRDPKSFEPICIETSWTVVDKETHDSTPRAYCADWDARYYFLVENSPLISRAWVAQERYLSTRMIHFTKGMVFWECCNTVATETYPEGFPGWEFKADLVGVPYALKRAVHLWRRESQIPTVPNSRQQHPPTSPVLSYHYLRIRELWLRFLQDYTNLGMTKERDRLKALHGILDDITEVFNDKHVFGLFPQRLMDELLWQTSAWHTEATLDPSRSVV